MSDDLPKVECPRCHGDGIEFTGEELCELCHGGCYVEPWVAESYIDELRDFYVGDHL